MKAGIVTPTRGDRSAFMWSASAMIGAQTHQDAVWCTVDFEPISDEVDIVPRLKVGVEEALKHGAEIIVFWEDDDYYPATYLEQVEAALERFDILAPSFSTYYHVGQRRWREMTGPSLFEMAMRAECAAEICWPKDGTINVDRQLLKWARRQEMRINRSLLPQDARPVGIKHGVGKCAGKGHSTQLLHADPNLEYLSTRVKNSGLLRFYADFGE